jgi:hypothetical protein
MKNLFTLLGALIIFDVSAQITPSDSSIQVITYWSKNDKQTYKVTNTKYHVLKGDTTGREVTTYDVDVTVQDSTEKSYTVEWKYKNVTAEGVNKFTASLMGLANNTRVVFKTDEMGAFIEVINWKEVQSLMKQGLEKIRKDFKDVPNIKAITAEVEKRLTTKEAIEEQGIYDILQFHTFHGAKYTLNEEYTKSLVSDGVPGHPVGVEMLVRVSDLNVEDDNAIVRMWKTYDTKQMTDATYEILKQMALGMGSKEFPKREEMPDVNFEESVFSRVHGSTGWVIYSIHTKQTATGDKTEVEEREIEIL